MFFPPTLVGASVLSGGSMPPEALQALLNGHNGQHYAGYGELIAAVQEKNRTRARDSYLLGLEAGKVVTHSKKAGRTRTAKTAMEAVKAAPAEPLSVRDQLARVRQELRLLAINHKRNF